MFLLYLIEIFQGAWTWDHRESANIIDWFVRVIDFGNKEQVTYLPLLSFGESKSEWSAILFIGSNKRNTFDPWLLISTCYSYFNARFSKVEKRFFEKSDFDW